MIEIERDTERDMGWQKGWGGGGGIQTDDEGDLENGSEKRHRVIFLSIKQLLL